ncbi:hypothetical protein RSOLAG22IIIB_02767 [Rhizoctonia solani]|uniref:Uncharacterized protein n=1 Tax=Rhizoctonia solani TaxID=456999 RepID=A0A0K6GIF2_9AGAM|nr:hypothetical protein RSOLAG22IIIB_02767 [Rhizoctonia solani]
MKLGTDLRIELTCMLEGVPIPPIRVKSFPFISAILTGLQEATFSATSMYWMDEHDKSDEMLRHFIVLRHESGTSVTPRLCMRSLELTLSLPERIHEFAQGLHVLESPPLPLQLCFDNLRSQLLAHLTSYYPSLFGEYAKTLHKNTEYLNSILTSLSRIFDRSANDSLKQQAQLHKSRLLDNVRSRLQNQAGGLGSTRISIEEAIARTEERTDGLAHSINQDICCVWLQLQPPEKQENITESVPVRDTDELEIHEDLPEPALEDGSSCGDPIIDTDSDEGLNVPWGYRSPCWAQTILDTDTPPQSPC